MLWTKHANKNILNKAEIKSNLNNTRKVQKIEMLPWKRIEIKLLTENVKKKNTTNNKKALILNSNIKKN